MKDTLIITGAGFGKEAALPLQKDIITTIQSRTGSQLASIEAKWDSIGTRRTFLDYTFEEILTFLVFEERAENRSHSERLDVQNVKLDLLSLLATILKTPAAIPTQYARLFGALLNRSYYATLNYDCLVEEYLKSNRISWNYGFEPDNSDAALSMNDGFLHSTRAESIECVEVLKLHGSFTWHFCWQCLKTRMSELAQFGVSARGSATQLCTTCNNEAGQAVMQPLIVPPSAIKLYNVALIRKMWARLRQVSSHVQRLVVCGCSLRDDETLLLNALDQLAHRNHLLRHLVVVNPDDDVCSATEDLIGMAASRFSSVEKYARVL